MGYYHAVIDGGDETRFDKIKRDGGTPELPPLDGLERLWKSWNEIGRTDGLDPLWWSEIEAFGRINGLARDEMIILRRMSAAYLDGMALKHPLSREPMDDQS